MLSDEYSFNKYSSASYAPDSVPDTEDAINTPAILLQRIYPKDIKKQACSSIQGNIYNQKENNKQPKFHL